MTSLEQLILNEIFSKADSTNWSHIILYKITEIIDDTIPSYRIEIIIQKDIMKLYYKNLDLLLLKKITMKKL